MGGAVCGRGNRAGQGFGEDATAAADVEIAEVVDWGGGFGCAGAWRWEAVEQTGCDEVVAEGVHEMQDPAGAHGIPPAAGEGGEVR